MWYGKQAPDDARSIISEVQRSDIIEIASETIKSLYTTYEPTAKDLYAKYELVAQEWDTYSTGGMAPEATLTVALNFVKLRTGQEVMNLVNRTIVPSSSSDGELSQKRSSFLLSKQVWERLEYLEIM